MNGNPAGDPSVVRDRATSGFLALLTRQVATVLITLPAGIALARILAPSDFGLYAIVGFLVMLLNQSLSLGFVSWIIQKPTEPTRTELNTLYTFQLGLYGLAFGALWLAAPWVLALYGRHDEAAIALLRALAVNIVLVAFRAIPSGLLERALDYKALALVELAGTLTYQLVALSLALLGYGPWSLVGALLATSAVVTLLMNWRAPWRPGLALDRDALRRALGFGSFWQLHQWVTLAKDNIVPTLVAARFGAAAVGHLNLAGGTVFKPLFIMPILQRVTFSLYARLQGDPRRLRVAIERALFLASFVVIPPTVLLAALAEPVLVLVYGEKWLPAVPALRWYCIPAVGATIQWTAISAMFALGRPALAMRITAAWTACLWLLSVLLTSYWGFTGAAMASAITTVLVVWTVYELKRLVPVRVLAAVGRVILVSAGAGAVAALVAHFATLTIGSLAALLVVMLPLSYAAITLVDSTQVLACLTELRRSSRISFGLGLDRFLAGLRRVEDSP
jgi:O-antigen/teichoic acid export membrane protein